MSEVTRIISLQEAAKFVLAAGGTADEVADVAEKFNAYLLIDATVPVPVAQVNKTTPAKPAPAAAKPAAAKPAAAKPVAAKPKAKTEEQLAAEAAAAGEEAADAVTVEQVGEALAAMLSGGKRVEAVALLKKFGATSKSTLAAEHFAEFVQEAQDILLG
jgi:hypothetical protein